MEKFKRTPVQVADLAADEEKIPQQLVDLPPVCVRVILEQDHIEIE